jgi:tRNA (guanine37-N1)-methyltransferase
VSDEDNTEIRQMKSYSTPMQFHVITIFPEIIESYTKVGILKRAIELKEKIEVITHNLRDFTTDAHQTVDDSPFGGGPGMVMKIEPLYKAIEHITQNYPSEKRLVVFFKASGDTFIQSMAREFALSYDQIIFICGRYEGIDARVEKYLSHRAISIGQFVLTGGELPALIMTDAISRMIPNVLGNPESALDDSFTKSEDHGEFPQFTRPASFHPNNPHLISSTAPEIWSVPEVLLSGNHAKIEEYRENQSIKITKKT